MSVIARPAEPLTASQRERTRQLRLARTCYSHLAGKLGVALCAKISELGWVAYIRDSRALRLNDHGKAALRDLLEIAL